MRISDWSSDVCSSDLPRFIQCPHGREQQPSRAVHFLEKGRYDQYLEWMITSHMHILFAVAGKTVLADHPSALSLAKRIRLTRVSKISPSTSSSSLMIPNRSSRSVKRQANAIESSAGMAPNSGVASAHKRTNKKP